MTKDDDAQDLNVTVGEAVARLEETHRFITATLPNKRERSCALTKLDEARMWLTELLRTP
jgi:hypothetical protein